MNVLQVLPELNVGGVETGVIDLSKYLVEHNHKSVVVSNGGTLVKELEKTQAKHYTLDVKTKSLFSILRAIPELVKIIKQENIDIVHARSRVPAWISFFAARKTKTTFITTCHGYYSRHIFSRVMGWGKLIIVPSRVIARHMIEDFKVPFDRIRKVERSVDLEKFKFNFPKEKEISKTFNIGLIGRISPIKGHVCFLRAISRIISQIPNLKAYIVGPVQENHSDYFCQLKSMVKKLAIIPYVEFSGKTNDVAGVLNNLDLLVMPSTAQESFGRVIIEAQAVGVCVIASRIGGIVDIIEENQTGLLFTPDADDELAKKIINIYNDRSLVNKLVVNARKKIEENYNLDKFGSSTVSVYNQAKSILKILVIKLSSLGDVILIIPSLRALREKFPTAQISVLVSEPFSQLITRCPYINEIIIYDSKNKHKGLVGIFKIASILKRKNFDKVIDFQNNKISHWFSFLSLSPERYGYRRKLTGFLLNNTVNDSSVSMSPIEHQFRTLNLLGIKLKDSRLELWPKDSDFDYIERFLKSHWLVRDQILVGVNLSASRKWQTKVLPLEKIAEICDELSKKDYQVVITGSLKEDALVSKLSKLLKLSKPIIAVGQTTAGELTALIKKCNVFITPDSAPMHIAAAVNTPFIALFGPTDPKRHLPPANKFIFIKKDLRCSPCYKPRCRDVQCMEQIKVEEVLEAVEKLLR